ncbi:hypothetical protein [Liquorilactobacillus sicerae]|uniref:hypothetical protein n=1 Tax=Liquorilactobacillus sicerae TaxID=1416943 RepID=UPI0024801F17|nr:hypothetical protein [Liquorilactobacillus sicerae]
MKFEQGKLLVIVFCSFSLWSLTACSATSQQNSSRETVTATNQNQKQKQYQLALKELDHGADHQAFERLKKVVTQNTATAKEKKLYNQLGRVLEAKKNLAAGNLTTAQTNLAGLEKVDQPVSLVKQITALKKELRASKLAKIYYQEIIAYYQAGKYTAAGGSYQALLDLSSKYQLVAAYQAKAAKYGKLVSQRQSQSAASSTSAESSSAVASAKTATSGYTNARNSKLLSSEYAQKTGSSISSATNSQVSSVAESLSNNQVLEKFFKTSQIPQEAGDQYYVKKVDTQTYQIEIRHTSPSDSNVSNLKGMYQFEITTGKVAKLNEVTGNYVNIN